MQDVLEHIRLEFQSLAKHGYSPQQTKRHLVHALKDVDARIRDDHHTQMMHLYNELIPGQSFVDRERFKEILNKTTTTSIDSKQTKPRQAFLGDSVDDPVHIQSDTESIIPRHRISEMKPSKLQHHINHIENTTLRLSTELTATRKSRVSVQGKLMAMERKLNLSEKKYSEKIQKLKSEKQRLQSRMDMQCSEAKQQNHSVRTGCPSQRTLLHELEHEIDGFMMESNGRKRKLDRTGTQKINALNDRIEEALKLENEDIHADASQQSLNLRATLIPSMSSQRNKRLVQKVDALELEKYKMRRVHERQLQNVEGLTRKLQAQIEALNQKLIEPNVHGLGEDREQYGRDVVIERDREPDPETEEIPYRTSQRRIMRNLLWLRDRCR